MNVQLDAPGDLVEWGAGRAPRPGLAYGLAGWWHLALWNFGRWSQLTATAPPHRVLPEGAGRQRAVHVDRAVRSGRPGH